VRLCSNIRTIVAHGALFSRNADKDAALSTAIVSQAGNSSRL
jgi:hypothetical protein